MAAAETLWVLTHEEMLKVQDWSKASKSLKGVVEGIKRGIEGRGGGVMS